MERQWKKAVTFSYDDAVTQDRRLISIFNKYGLKGTFNLNSGFLGTGGSLVREEVTVAHAKSRPVEIPQIYKGHEVAAHTIHHPMLNTLPDEAVIEEVEGDRLALSEIVGYEVVGMAYPGSSASATDHVQELIRQHTGIRYARNTSSNGRFSPQENLISFCPTVYHHNNFQELFRLGEEFLALDESTLTEPAVFYIWGHAYEFDIHDDWDLFEAFCKRISGKPDIFYGTNRECLLND